MICAAISQAPSCAKYRNSLGVLYQNSKKSAEAADAFERANEKDPMNVAVGRWVGSVRKLGDASETLTP